jgi:hypothetical protein
LREPENTAQLLAGIKKYEGIMEKEAMRIRFDFSNVMSDNLGDLFGLKEAVLKNYQEQVTVIHHDFLRRAERGEFAFMNLPKQKEVLDEILDFTEKNAGRFESYVHLGIIVECHIGKIIEYYGFADIAARHFLTPC